MRMSMIKGTRRSAKATVVWFVDSAIKKLEMQCVPSAIDEQLRTQLKIYQGIARHQGWTDLDKKITRALGGSSGQTN